jgi:hypothetical protein
MTWRTVTHLALLSLVLSLKQVDEGPAKYQNGAWSFSLEPPRFSYADKLVGRIIAFFSGPPGNDMAPGEEVWVYKSMEWADTENKGNSLDAVATTKLVVGNTPAIRRSWTSDSPIGSMSWIALVVQGKDCVFVVRCRAPTSKFEELKAAFEASIASFRVSPDPAASKDGPIYADSRWGFSLIPAVLPRPKLEREPIGIAVFMGPSQPKYPTSVRLSISAQPGSVSDFKKRQNEMIANLKRDKEAGLTVSETKDTIVDSHACVEWVFAFDAASCGRNIEYIVTAIPAADFIYVFTGEALEAEFDKYVQVFRNAISSFREVE